MFNKLNVLRKKSGADINSVTFRPGICVLVVVFLFLSVSVHSLSVIKDNAVMREGPEVFFSRVTMLKKGAEVKKINESDNGLWIQVSFNDKKGWIAASYLGEKSTGTFNPYDMMGGVPVNKTGKEMEISPGSYVAAVKGFAEDFAKKKVTREVDITTLLGMTKFTEKEYRWLRFKLHLKKVLLKKNLLGKKEIPVTQNLEAIALGVSIAVLSDGVVNNPEMTKKINIIANILNSQTINYDVRIRCWIIPGKTAAAYSAPAGYLFFTEGLISALDDDKELIAIIGHELGHLAEYHGYDDLAVELSKMMARDAASRLDQMLIESGSDAANLKLAEELEGYADDVFEKIKIIRDSFEEYEADAFAVEILKLNRIKTKFLVSALQKAFQISGLYDPRYAAQLNERLKKLK